MTLLLFERFEFCFHALLDRGVVTPFLIRPGLAAISESLELRQEGAPVAAFRDGHMNHFVQQDVPLLVGGEPILDVDGAIVVRAEAVEEGAEIGVR